MEETMRDVTRKQLANRFKEAGYLAFASEDSPFSIEERGLIRHLAVSDPSRFTVVNTGDTKEAAAVYVHRLLVDGDTPRSTDVRRVDALLDIVATPSKLALYGNILETDRLAVRRMQAHALASGGFIGRHRDSESSDRYLAAIVIQLDAADAGGDFVIHRPDAPTLLLHDFSVLVTDAKLEHEVSPVLAGRRHTLVFWLAQA